MTVTFTWCPAWKDSLNTSKFDISGEVLVCNWYLNLALKTSNLALWLMKSIAVALLGVIVSLAKPFVDFSNIWINCQSGATTLSSHTDTLLRSIRSQWQSLLSYGRSGNWGTRIVSLAVVLLNKLHQGFYWVQVLIVAEHSSEHDKCIPPLFCFFLCVVINAAGFVSLLL